MSANTYTFTCIGSDAAALARLLALLQLAMQAPDAALPEPLDRFFEYWDDPVVMSASLLGTTLRCTVDTSAHDPLEKPQVLAWHASGAEYLRVHVFNSQVGESATTYYHAGKRITAKAFPKPVLSEGERLYELVLEAKDGALAKEVKAGASPNTTADGVPIMVLALRAGLVKSVRALHDAGVDWSACLPWAAEVAELIGACGGNQREAMLSGLLHAPGVDLPALSRLKRVAGPVSVHPKLLQWLLAQPGVDVNALLVDDHSGQETGSLLFHSVEFFEDRADVLKVLTACGARSVPPAQMSNVERLTRMCRGYRDAQTPAQLAASGVDLETPLWREYPALRMVMRNYTGALVDLRLANDLLDAGAGVDYWKDPEAFQEEVVEPLLTVYWYEPSNASGKLASRLDADACQIVIGTMRRVLERGVSAAMEVSLQVDDLETRHEGESPPSACYAGSLLGAVAGLLCVRGSILRPLCLPLVTLLLENGADPHGPCTRGIHLSDRRRIWGWGNWPELHNPWPGGASVLAYLQERQAKAPDPIDAAVIAAMHIWAPTTEQGTSGTPALSGPNR